MCISRRLPAIYQSIQYLLLLILERLPADTAKLPVHHIAGTWKNNHSHTFMPMVNLELLINLTLLWEEARATRGMTLQTHGEHASIHTCPRWESNVGPFIHQATLLTAVKQIKALNVMQNEVFGMIIPTGVCKTFWCLLGYDNDFCACNFVLV